MKRKVQLRHATQSISITLSNLDSKQIRGRAEHYPCRAQGLVGLIFSTPLPLDSAADRVSHRTPPFHLLPPTPPTPPHPTPGPSFPHSHPHPFSETRVPVQQVYHVTRPKCIGPAGQRDLDAIVSCGDCLLEIGWGMGGATLVRLCSR